MNTTWVDRNGVFEALGEVSDLRIFLAAIHRPVPPGLGRPELAVLLGLRTALRTLGRTPDDPGGRPSDDRRAAVETVNAALAAAPAADVLATGPGGWTLARADGPSFPATASRLAREGAAVLADPSRPLRVCHAPGCALFFVRNHRRRRWCSTECGNRARAARYYQRHRPDGSVAAGSSVDGCRAGWASLATSRSWSRRSGRAMPATVARGFVPAPVGGRKASEEGSFGDASLDTPGGSLGGRDEVSVVFFAQYYLDCLSQASYMIGDEGSGRAVVVDPRRDVAEYLADARVHGLSIVGVVNTHFHADFLAGHLELAEATGAWIGYGRRAVADYPVRGFADGERIVLGDVVLQILETPGHTPESISVVVFEHAVDEVPYGVLSGDALFIGDVGRPDLLASIGVSADELGRMLYASVGRLMALPDGVRVFPAHGAGSACGKDLSTERWSTIGEQRVSNYACRPMSEEDFLALVTAGQPAAPGYFVYDAILNRRQRPVLDVGAAPVPLGIGEVLAAQEAGAVVLDARDPVEFAAGHLVGSLNVPADGRFAETAGMVVAPEQVVVVVAPQDREEEVVLRLARIGFDRVVGYLREPGGVFLDNPERVARASRVTAFELAAALEHPERLVVLDVRNAGELAGGAIFHARHIPLAQLPRRLAEVPSGRPVVAYCAGGYRSSAAASLLRREGWSDVSDLIGGFTAWTVLTAQPVR